ncbi:neuritin-like, partial [Arapaima gigas]
PVLQTPGVSATCDSVFKGFSDCLLALGENMVSYRERAHYGHDLRTVCTYWEDFHMCAHTAIADCEEGAAELWEKLKRDSRKLELSGTLFELCAGDGGASAPRGALLTFVSALLAAWVLV